MAAWGRAGGEPQVPQWRCQAPPPPSQRHQARQMPPPAASGPPAAYCSAYQARRSEPSAASLPQGIAMAAGQRRQQQQRLAAVRLQRGRGARANRGSIPSSPRCLAAALAAAAAPRLECSRRSRSRHLALCPSCDRQERLEQATAAAGHQVLSPLKSRREQQQMGRQCWATACRVQQQQQQQGRVERLACRQTSFNWALQTARRQADWSQHLQRYQSSRSSQRRHGSLSCGMTASRAS
jgi:hypothetical protein